MPGPSPVPPGPGPSPVPAPPGPSPVFPPPLASGNGLPSYTMPPDGGGPTGVLPPMSYGTPGFPPAPGNGDLTQPVNLADMTMPLSASNTSAANNSDMTMPVNLAGTSDRTMPVNLAGANSDMTMPVNLASANIDATMPVNVVSMPGTVPGQRGQGQAGQYGHARQQTPAGQPDHGGQLAPGTLYSTGGYPAIDMTMPVSNPVENSGSLTGHILAQGWYDAPVDQRRGNFKVVMAMLASSACWYREPGVRVHRGDASLICSASERARDSRSSPGDLPLGGAALSWRGCALG